MKLRFLTSALVLFSIGLMSCNNDPKESFMLYSHDGELPHGWINLNSLQKVEDAPSGFHVSVIDANCPYGIGFKDVVKAFPLHFSSRLSLPFNVVEVACMVRSEMPTGKVSLVLSLDSSGVQKHWEGVAFEKEVQNQTYKEIKARFKLPHHTRAEDVLTTYVMNNLSDKVYVDNYSMKLFLE